MDIVRSAKNLKRFHVQLLHGKSRALPIFPDLQHRSGEVEQTVSICDIQNLQGMQFPQHIIQRLKGDDPSVLSIPEAPYDELITTSYQPPLYQKCGWRAMIGLPASVLPACLKECSLSLIFLKSNRARIPIP